MVTRRICPLSGAHSGEMKGASVEVKVKVKGMRVYGEGRQ